MINCILQLSLRDLLQMRNGNSARNLFGGLLAIFLYDPSNECTTSSHEDLIRKANVLWPYLLSFDILHAEHNQIPVVEIGGCKRCTILEVGIAVSQLHFTHRQRCINDLDDTITQGGNQKVKRQIRDFDDGAVELPFGLVRHRRQLHGEGDGVRMHADPIGFL